MSNHATSGAASPCTVTAIIPTACEPQRWTLLNRAIKSLLTQEGVAVDVVVVANGARFDIAQLTELYRRGDIRVVYSGESGVAGAQRKGRELVTGDFFCFLDDDDEYLPGAIARRIAPMLNDDTLSLVATNGVRSIDGTESPVYTASEATAAERDPEKSLSVRNWLTSCGGLYRTSNVSFEFFDGVTSHQEWTLLAYRLLAAGRKVRFIDALTYRVNDTPASLSKATSHQGQEIAVLEKVLALGLPEDVHQTVEIKLGRALHALAARALASGNWWRAVRAHARSLAAPKGWRYLPYTRKLLVPNIARR